MQLGLPAPTLRDREEADRNNSIINESTFHPLPRDREASLAPLRTWRVSVPERGLGPMGNGGSVLFARFLVLFVLCFIVSLLLSGSGFDAVFSFYEFEFWEGVFVFDFL
jgi:hypothetical protein